jgi:hypothetical protein
MSDPVLAAIISAVVALLTAGATALVSWRQMVIENTRLLQDIERERVKWLTDVKAEYSKELYKERLKAYPAVLQIIGQLSTRAASPLTPQIAAQVAMKINEWLYSGGGLCAAKETRGALIGLREECLNWRAARTTENCINFEIMRSSC